MSARGQGDGTTRRQGDGTTRRWGDAAARERIEAALEAVAAGRARRLKQGRRKALYALDLAGEGRVDHLLKHNRYTGLESWLRRLRGSKSRREWYCARDLAARGAPVAVPAAALERRRGGAIRDCYLLIDPLADAEDLRARWRSGGAAAERRALCAAFGAAAGRVHDAGLLQDDFAPNNFLVRGRTKPEVVAIDFERAGIGPGPAPDTDRLAALAKLNRRLSADVSCAHRLRFLLAYADGDRAAARRWWARVSAAAPEQSRRDARRWRRVLTRDGRRFHRVVSTVWQGFARRDAELAALATAATSAAPTGLTASEGCWVLGIPVPDGTMGPTVWTHANLLFERDLAPRPLAWLEAGDRGCLLWSRADAAPAGASDAPDVRAALAVLRRRLAGHGELVRPPEAGEVLVSRERGTLRARLLDPRLWHPPSRRA